MFCTQCAAPISSGSPRCSHCGQMPLISRLEPLELPARPVRGWQGIGWLITMLLPFAVALLVGGWFSWTVVSNHRDESAAYRSAEEALATGDYSSAVDGFTAAGSYRDAAERRAATQQLLAPVHNAYLDAVTSLELGDYAMAIALLEPISESMPEFQDVAVLLEEARMGQRRGLERDVDLAVAHRDWMAADNALVSLIGLYPDEIAYRDELDRLRESHAPILFARGGKLYQIGPDGRDETLLFDAFPVVAPQWSPDRQHITFLDGNASRSMVTTLYLFEISSGSVEVVSDWAAPAPFVAWMADSSQFAFVVNAATSDMKPSNRTRLALFDMSTRSVDLVPMPSTDEATGAVLSDVASPTWSPGGDRLAFVGISRPSQAGAMRGVPFADVYITDLAALETTNLTEHAIPTVSYVTWSPVNDNLLIWESAGGTAWFDTDETAIWLLDALTGDAQRLTVRTETTDWPAWSPDGQSYAVIANGSTVIVRSLRGDELVRAETNRDLTGRVTWSPGGTVLLAAADRPQEPSVTVDVRRGSESVQSLVIDFDGHWPNAGPQWSAGGTFNRVTD